jgi:hypothetical protein
VGGFFSPKTNGPPIAIIDLAQAGKKTQPGCTTREKKRGGGSPGRLYKRSSKSESLSRLPSSTHWQSLEAPPALCTQRIMHVACGLGLTPHSPCQAKISDGEPDATDYQGGVRLEAYYQSLGEQIGHNQAFTACMIPQQQARDAAYHRDSYIAGAASNYVPGDDDREWGYYDKYNNFHPTSPS